jgi:LmbE family N-acetylglucosaminyl deacetylase
VVNVVAHQDDDLLFLNPDLQRALDSGLCVTTVYLTAGDAAGTLEGGSTPESQAYWRDGRETGALAAHTQLTGAGWGWYETDAGVPGRPIQAVDNAEDPRQRLIFMRLKDGLQGRDLNPLLDTPVKTLWKTWKRLSDIQSLSDDQHPERARQTYSRQQLINALGSIYRNATHLVRINTQDPRTTSVNPASGHYDHPDHVATALFAKAARDRFFPGIPIHEYVGYSVDTKAANVTGAGFDRKLAAFSTYAVNDKSICGQPTLDSACPNGLGSWYPVLLARQYRIR